MNDTEIKRLRELCDAVTGFVEPSPEELRLADGLSRCLDEIQQLMKVYDAARTWCESVYIGKPHPRLPAYPGDELLHAVNAIRRMNGAL